jgi:Protein of unknown function (DUF3618)
MAETVDQIEAHIDRTRQRLGSNLDELERRVDAATDWREQFRARPYTALGVAFAGGVVMATVLRRRSPGQRFATVRAAAAPSRRGIEAREQALDVWNNIKQALIGVATTRVTDYMGELIPGFHEHLQRAEQRGPQKGSVRNALADPEGRT